MCAFDRILVYSRKNLSGFGFFGVGLNPRTLTLNCRFELDEKSMAQLLVTHVKHGMFHKNKHSMSSIGE